MAVTLSKQAADSPTVQEVLVIMALEVMGEPVEELLAMVVQVMATELRMVRPAEMSLLQVHQASLQGDAEVETSNCMLLTLKSMARYQLMVKMATMGLYHQVELVREEVVQAVGVQGL